MIGATPDTKTKVYLIDFGLSKMFLDATGARRIQKKYYSFGGTTKYACVQAYKKKVNHQAFIFFFQQNITKQNEHNYI